MAHLVSDEIFRPGFMSRPVKTETDKVLSSHTLEDVIFILHLLAYNNTRYDKTAAQLERDYGIIVHSTTLRRWVSSYFVERYVQIQHELTQQLNEKLSAKTVDLAAQAADAQEQALEKTVDGLERASDMAPIVAASIAQKMAQTSATNIEKAQLLRDSPTQIIQHKNPDEALKTLEKMGLLDAVDAEVVEDT